MKKITSKQITLSGIMIAVSTVLSMIKVIQMPLGGSVTLLAMLPVSMISVIYGVSFAIIPCIIFGVIQILLGGAFGWGLTPEMLIGTIMFDYVLAYGVLCLSGVFRNRGTLGIIAGIILACFARLLCHIVSGVVIFENLEQFSAFGATFENRPILYSVCYNGLFMLPETLFTCIGAFVIAKLNVIKDLITKNMHSKA